METGILHTHYLVVTLFFVFFLFKAFLLLLGRTEQLTKIREKTKIVDMVLGVLILGTGVYLGFVVNWPTWIIIKLAIVLALIPLGIIGLKKQNKMLAVISLIGFAYIFGASEAGSLTMSKADYSGEEAQASTESIYLQECSKCHGSDGKAMKFGSKDLTKGTLSTEEKIALIKNGKGMMPAFGHLSDQQIEALAKYTETLGDE